jgi:two-component system response regulator MtrA
MAQQRALIVDNNASLAEAVAEILAGSGFEVDVALSGVDALAAWRVRPADLVVLDVDLPDIGGLTLARRLMRRAAGCKLLVMSAGEPQSLSALCEEVGAAFLAKPFSPAHLVSVIRLVLGGETGRSARPTVRPLLGPRSLRRLLPQERPSRNTR